MCLRDEYRYLNRLARFGYRGGAAFGVDSRSFNTRIEIKRWTNNQRWMLKRRFNRYPRIIAPGQFPDRGEFPFSLSFLLIIADKPIVPNESGSRFQTGRLRTNNLGPPSFTTRLYLFRKLTIGDDLVGGISCNR